MGDFLSSGGTGLSLGEATSPRIWVYQPRSGPRRKTLSPKSAREHADLPSARWEPRETPRRKPRTHRRRSKRNRRPAPALVFCRTGCGSPRRPASWPGAIGRGTIGRSWRRYSAVAEARRVAGSQRHVRVNQPGNPGVPFDRPPSYAVRNTARYAFEAGGTTHYVEWSSWERPPTRLSVCYEPEDPDKNILGLPTPPWEILLVARAGRALGFLRLSVPPVTPLALRPWRSCTGGALDWKLARCPSRAGSWPRQLTLSMTSGRSCIRPCG